MAKQPNLEIWAKSQHICGEVLKELAMIRDKDNAHMNIHKEEGNARIKNDVVQVMLKIFEARTWMYKRSNCLLQL